MIKADSSLNNKSDISRTGFTTIISASNGEPVHREDGRLARFSSDDEPADIGQELPPGWYRVRRYDQLIRVRAASEFIADIAPDPELIPIPDNFVLLNESWIEPGGDTGLQYNVYPESPFYRVDARYPADTHWRITTPDVFPGPGGSFITPHESGTFDYELLYPSENNLIEPGSFTYENLI